MDRRLLRLLCLLLLLVGLAGCDEHDSKTFSDPSSGLSLRYPQRWSATGFSEDVSPARLVVASYLVRAKEVEGDCGGSAALRRLPRDGAAVLLIDYGTNRGFPPHPSPFKLSQFQHAVWECFGDSYRLRFRRDGHDLQAYVALGKGAGASQRSEALGVLDSLG
jgi:hypothetical protein